MATAQLAAATSSLTNAKGGKTKAARTAKAEAKQDLRNAKTAADDFVTAVRSSATHFGEHIGQKATYKAASAINKVQTARFKAEDSVRARPLAAVGVAAGIGLLLGILTRR